MRTNSVLARLQERLERTPDWMIDVAIATMVVLSGLASTARSGTDNGTVFRDRDAVALLLVLVATVPYYLRRRAPFTVFAVSTVSVTILMLRENDGGSLPLVLMLGAYTVASYRPVRTVIAAAVLMAVALVVLVIGDAPGLTSATALSSGVGFGGAMVFGRSMQTRRARIDAFEEEQVRSAQRAAADERLRIAQELHDVVAHSLGVIAVQAGVGMHVIDSDPEEARRALEHISRTSRSSLAEIRRLLGMVRSVEGAPTYTPAPGLADLPHLAEQISGAGLPVEVELEGDLRTDAIPAGLGLAAYRIVQEALTNALRHAGAARASVKLTATRGELMIEVSDDGRGPNGDESGGHGLVGMRERVALFGGSLSAGPGVGGGFRVAALLPYDADAQS